MQMHLPFDPDMLLGIAVRVHNDLSRLLFIKTNVCRRGQLNKPWDPHSAHPRSGAGASCSDRNEELCGCGGEPRPRPRATFRVRKWLKKNKAHAHFYLRFPLCVKKTLERY